MLAQLAWRNIWRNRQRTYITGASILFAVMLASFMEALQRGAWDHTIQSVVNYHYGFLQVQGKGFWDEQSIDGAIPFTEQLATQMAAAPKVRAVVPRIEAFALAAAGQKTAGVMAVGVLPDVEDQLTGLQGRLTQGTYFDADDHAVLLAEGVADNLGLRVGDTVVFLSQGYQGVNAAGKYPVKGLVSFGSPDLNRTMAYLPLDIAQDFYGAPGMVTSVALKLDGQDDIPPTVRHLRATLDTSALDILDWKQMMPDLMDAKALDSAGNVLVYCILYLIIAFGIFGTILMMTKERAYEFGVLLAIGMKRRQLGLMVWMEAMALAALGAFAGVLASFPLVWWFHIHPIQFSGEYASAMEQFGFQPIIPAVLDVRIFLVQALVVFLLTGLIALYPVLKIRTLQPVEAMRQ